MASSPPPLVDNVSLVDATIPSRFLHTVQERAADVAIRRKVGDGYEVLTFGEYAARATRLAAGLRDLGVGPGDRLVMLIGNRPEFHVADMAALLLGATPISIYNSSSPDQIRYLAGHAQASVAIVEDASYLERVLEARPELRHLRHVVVLEPVTASGVERWDDLLGSEPLDLETAAATAQPHDLATVIYTSGTTGPPKGVMLDHANICWTVDSLREALGFAPERSRIVSYLPMAHIAERVTTHYSGIAFAYEVTTCADIRLLGATLAETRPQILFGVPRTYEKIHSAVQAVLASDPGRAEVFARALAVGARVAEHRARSEALSTELAAEYERVDAESLRPARQLLGLDDVRIAVTAAAPIPVEVLQFFRSAGVPLSEMYGLSESSGPMTWESVRVKPGTVGRAIPGMELRLGDDGEVLGRGGNIFRGYLDDEARTAEALDADGWLHTGDIGELDDEGYLRIVDRKKELIITAGGKNVSPANLEAALKAQPLIGQACVLGDGEPYIAALLVLDPDVAPAWAANHGLDATSLVELAADPVVLAEVEREVEAANERFSHAESVRRFHVLGEEWLPDSEELTPTMKLKRRGIAARYAPEIAELYPG
jgi:long-subunit acyl-CoA synthetase (AMP-forming)